MIDIVNDKVESTVLEGKITDFLMKRTGFFIIE